MSRTIDAAEYYVAGRRVPAFFNGMATGADWMSAASFIGMAGTLYLQRLRAAWRYVLGWTGGYCLVALLLAPLPAQVRPVHDSRLPRRALRRQHPRAASAIFAAILCSFTYVVAQIYGVGLITTPLHRASSSGRRVPRPGRHPGVLVPRRHARGHLDAGGAVHHPDHRLPHAGGLARRSSRPACRCRRSVLRLRSCRRSASARRSCIADPKEREVAAIFQGARRRATARKLQDVAKALAARPRWRRRRSVADAEGAATRRWREIQAAEKRARAPCRATRRRRASVWTRGAGDERRRAPAARRHAAARAAVRRRSHGDAAARSEFDDSRAQLPRAGVLPDGRHGGAAAHPDALLHDALGAPGARVGVLVAVLHLPAVLHGAGARGAGQVRGLHVLVGSTFDRAAGLVGALVDRSIQSLLSVTDINSDGIVQLGEIAIGGDIIVLATPEIAGLPYVVSGLVAAGGLAAALSTADGLLLTIANALSHDLYYKMIDPKASSATPGDDLEDAAAGGGARRGLRGVAKAGRHPVPGVGGVLARGLGVLPGAGARRLLEARQQLGRRRSAWRPASASRCTTWCVDAAVAARRVRHQRRRSSCGSASGRSPPACSASRSGLRSASVVSLLTPRDPNAALRRAAAPAERARTP